MPPSDGDARSAGHNSRSRDQAFVDGVPQVYSEKRFGSNVTYRGEAGFQSFARIDHRGKGAGKRRVLEVIDFVITVRAGAEMRVTGNQSRKYGSPRKINDGGAGRKPATLNPCPPS